ncbi:MAG: PAS domain S-box protein [Cyanobacteria bacterium J06633_2]
MANRTVSFRLPEEIVGAIEKRAKVLGKTKTDLFIEALCQVYDVPAPESASLTITSLQQQLDGLRNQIETLEHVTHSSQAKFQQQVTVVFETLGQLLQPLQDEETSPTVSEADYRDERSLVIADNVSAEVVPVDESVQNTSFIALLDLWSTPEAGQLAAQAQHQMRMFDKVFSAIPELMFICDRSGYYTYISPFGVSVWGIERSEIIGRKYDDANLPPEFLEFNLAQFEMVLSFGKLSSSEVKVSSGSSIRYYDYTLSPIQDEEGIIVGVVGVVLDITQRKQAEISLQDSLERYRMMFEMANDMIFIVDAETHQIIDANLKASRRLRYTRKELCQLKIEDIETDESAEYFQAVIIPKLEKVGSAIYSHILCRKNGNELPVEISVRLVEFGDRLAYQSFAREITERNPSQPSD